MYRVFESLDELVEMVETARGMPMSSSCVVPRSTTLDLLDDVRDALPAEMHDAQAVLDERDGLVEDARNRADSMIAEAEARARQLVTEAEEHAQQLTTDARAQADHTVESARAEADRRARDGRAEYERQVADGRAEYDRLVAAGQAEHERLLLETTVYQAAAERARQVEGEAASAAERMRQEADGYVEDKLAGFADTLQRTLRAVENGRASLRSGHSGWRSGNGEVPAESTWQAPLR
jgi:cell division septum initiation protein DivIVA